MRKNSPYVSEPEHGRGPPGTGRRRNGIAYLRRRVYCLSTPELGWRNPWMPLKLLKYGLGGDHLDRKPMATSGGLKPSYDIVIIGGGGHGLATAYYLAKDWGIRNIAVLEKSYLGGGNTGSTWAAIRGFQSWARCITLPAPSPDTMP